MKKQRKLKQHEHYWTQGVTHWVCADCTKRVLFTYPYKAPPEKEQSA